jgi:nucleotidyltransferase/DNA polymerase involved in DNA repair
MVNLCMSADRHTSHGQAVSGQMVGGQMVNRQTISRQMISIQNERPSPKVACVAVDHLAVEVERRARPELVGQVVIVGGLPHERKAVYDVSAEGVRAGVRRGMPLRQAHQLCPDAAFIPMPTSMPTGAPMPTGEDSYRRAHDELLDLLEEFSPTVEPAGMDGAYLDASGLTLLFGEDAVLAARIVEAIRRRMGMGSRVGIGPGKFAARLAARLAAERPVVVAPGEVQRFLGKQSASLLPLGPDAQDRLVKLGIRSIGQFARLPAQDLASHFGPEGVVAHRLARGEDSAPVVPRPRPSVLVAAREVEGIPDRERLGYIAAHLVGKLADRLQREGRGCRTLALRLDLEGGGREAEVPRQAERSAQLRQVTDDAGELRRALERLLDEVEDEVVGRVVRLEVALTGLGQGPSRQLGLFDAQRERRASLDQAVDRIQRRFGDRIKRVVVADENAWLPSRKFALKDY